MDGSTMDMTRGKPWRLITAFAIPVLLSQVFQQLYNTADALIVGRFLGDEADSYYNELWNKVKSN